MTETQHDKEGQSAAVTSKQTASGDTPDFPVYTYETAGVTERSGNVPAWLWVVVVSLLIWGVYYLVTNWNAPASP